MITGITHMHSAFRWLLLIMLIITIIKHFSGKSSGKEYAESDKKLALFTLIFAHLQLLFGLFLYFKGPMVEAAYKVEGGVMKDAVARFWAMEHIVGMILAIILITVGYSRAKKATSSIAKYKKISMMYLFALIIIIINIPWPFREGFESLGWF